MALFKHIAAVVGVVYLRTVAVLPALTLDGQLQRTEREMTNFSDDQMIGVLGHDLGHEWDEFSYVAMIKNAM